MYERVPRNRPPLLQHLEDPVIEYVPLHWPAQHHRFQDLPMGKYIVCGEAHKEGHVVQANCFETVIDRLDNNMLPGGVVGVICVAIIPRWARSRKEEQQRVFDSIFDPTSLTPHQRFLFNSIFDPTSRTPRQRFCERTYQSPCLACNRGSFQKPV